MLNEKKLKNVCRTKSTKPYYYFIEITTPLCGGKATKKYCSKHYIVDSLCQLNPNDAFNDLHKMIVEIIQEHDVIRKFFNSKIDDETNYQIIKIEDGKKTFSELRSRYELESCIHNIKLFKE